MNGRWVVKAALLFLLLLAPGAISAGTGALSGGLPGIPDRASTVPSQPQPTATAEAIAPTPEPTPEPTPIPDPSLYRLPANWQKGVVLWDRPESFGSPASFQSLRELRDVGATSISPVVTWYVAGPWDPHIHPGKKTPTDDDLIAVIDEAHNLGLQVMLRFHIDCEDGNWRARIDPQDKEAFFNAYTTVLGYYAGLARDHAVEGIAIGAELSSLTKPAYTDYWRSVIAQVRQRFPGFLTYSAQWGSAPPDALADPFREFEQIQFWDDLDYLGISGYFELVAAGQTPSLQSYIDMWSR
ncbi:MAG TPA: hypothetical protein VHS28_08205, partial [Chloroflexota bacterium]|nr:hypothetical protein [Chloroflexota bacterium]